MRVVVQRVLEASVAIDGKLHSRIGPGLLVLAGWEEADTTEDNEWIAQKISKMRLFPDAEGVMNRSVVEAGGELLVVSQFTLHASTKKATVRATSRRRTLGFRFRCTRSSSTCSGTRPTCR